MVSNIKNFNENIEDDNEELEPSIEELFDIDDLLNNDKTKEILTNQHYFDFLYNMENKIQNLYIKFKNNSKCYHFLDNDEFDLDGMFFVDIVYKHIYKKYTPDFFYDNPELAEPLFENDTKNKINKKKKILIKNKNKNNKNFNWNTKTYE